MRDVIMGAALNDQMNSTVLVLHANAGPVAATKAYLSVSAAEKRLMCKE